MFVPDCPGPEHPSTAAGRQMLDKCIALINDQEQGLINLEKLINPLLDDNPQVMIDDDKFIQT